MRERAVRFGASSGMVGILSSPAQSDDERPGILLLNSGILHRVGACRLHVRLARRLAAEGYPVLRFDFSGIGDSEVRRDGLAFEQSALVETREAMDFLAAKAGCKRFVAIGLCSGADMAFEAACTDARIAGIGLLDPWIYRTPGHWLRRIGPKLFRPSAWAHSIRVRVRPAPDAVGRLPSAEESEVLGIELPTYVRVFPPKRVAAEKLRGLVARGVEICCVFSGGEPHYNYEGQFRACFRSVGLGARLVEIFRREADHIFTPLAEQQALLDRLSAWIASRFGGIAPGAAERSAAA